MDTRKPGIIALAPNGASAHVTALQEGETKVTVAHPDSQNALTLFVKVGSEYIHNNPKTAFISLSADTVPLVKDAKPATLKASLTNAGGAQGGFSLRSIILKSPLFQVPTKAFAL